MAKKDQKSGQGGAEGKEPGADGADDENWACKVEKRRVNASLSAAGSVLVVGMLSNEHGACWISCNRAEQEKPEQAEKNAAFRYDEEAEPL